MNDLLAIMVAIALGFGAGWSWQGSRADARVADLTTQHEKASREAAEDAGLKLKASEDLVDSIDKAAAIRTATLERKLQETQHALKTATRNRPCLGGPALRVLDRAPGIRLGTAEAALAS
ncbi:MAG: hypothetical protein NT159_00635, partial [Proteobacteria bacterium]|nr:hypothetical protein [Pseudomonadota bacterium]